MRRPLEDVVIVLGESDGRTSERIPSPGPGMVSVMLTLSGDFTFLGRDMNEWRIPANSAAVMFRTSESLFDLVAQHGSRLLVLSVHIGLTALSQEPFRTGLKRFSGLLDPREVQSVLLATVPLTRELRSLALQTTGLFKDDNTEDAFSPAVQTLELLAGLAETRAQNGLVTRPMPAKGHLEKLFAIKALIESDYGAALRLADLADRFSLSQSRMTQAFQAAFGLSPLAYLNKVRLEHAQEMLKGTDASIGQIAWSLGYGHQGNFSVAFKRAVGVTPKQFRAFFTTGSDMHSR
jgi:AraC-like DNA-binding protein